MRFQSSLPATQLKSVSCRYRNSLSVGPPGRQGTLRRSTVSAPRSMSGVGCLITSASLAMLPNAGNAALATNSAPRSLKYGREAGRRRPSQAISLDPNLPVERDERLSRLEAVLLLAKEPLHPRKLSKFANLADGTEALTLVSRLNHLYDLAARAFRAEEVAGGWQLRTRPQFASWLRRLQHVPSALRLSAPAMETLAVVAYRQPVVRVDVEEVRGVACGEILRQLMERDLVRVSGRSEDLGRPYFYSTTQYFLQAFGLRDLDELPRVDWFRQALEQDVVPPATEVRCDVVEDDDEEEFAYEYGEDDDDEDDDEDDD